MKIANIIFGSAWFVLGIFLVVKTWTWFTTVGELILDDYFLVIYWISYTAIISIIAFVMPVVIIINGYRDS